MLRGRGASRGERAGPGLSPAEREEELAMRYRFLAARESELEAEKERARSLEIELEGCRRELEAMQTSASADCVNLAKENAELRQRLATGTMGVARGARVGHTLQAELERLRREVATLQSRGCKESSGTYEKLRERLEEEARQKAQEEVEEAQRRFNIMTCALRNQIEAESKASDELRAALKSTSNVEPAEVRLESLLEEQLMKQAETLSQKDSKIAELEEELALLKRKSSVHLHRIAPGLVTHYTHTRQPSFAESASGAEEELPEDAPDWVREDEDTPISITGEKVPN